MEEFLPPDAGDRDTIERIAADLAEVLGGDDSDYCKMLGLPRPEEQPEHLAPPVPQLGHHGTLPHPAAVAGGFVRPDAANNGFPTERPGYHPSLSSPRVGVPPGAASLPSQHVPLRAEQQQFLPPGPQQDQLVPHGGHYRLYHPGAAAYYGPRGGDAYFGHGAPPASVGHHHHGALPASVGHHHHGVPTGSVVSAPMALVETSALRQQQQQLAAQASRLPRYLDTGAASTSRGPRPSNFATASSSIPRNLIERKDVGLLLTSTWSAQHVVHLLESSDEEVQHVVLDHVRSRIGTMMADKEGSKVFLALVHSSGGDGQALGSIVEGVAGAPALRTKNDEEFDNWINSLRSVITAVAEEPPLIKMLLHSLLNKRLMDSAREEELTKHLFNSVPTEILCEHVIEFLASNRECARHMSGFLIELYRRASGKFLRDVEDLLIENAVGLAVGAYSNYLLQHVLMNCSHETKRRFVEKLAQDIVSLCADRRGGFMMCCCFNLPDATLDTEMMHLGLDALIGLNDDGLSEMVNGTESSTVVCEALKKRQCGHLNTKVRALALRINQLPEVALGENESCKAVLRFADRALRSIKPNIPNLHDS